jgi:hypothetical protein
MTEGRNAAGESQDAAREVKSVSEAQGLRRCRQVNPLWWLTWRRMNWARRLTQFAPLWKLCQNLSAKPPVLRNAIGSASDCQSKFANWYLTTND